MATITNINFNNRNQRSDSIFKFSVGNCTFLLYIWTSLRKSQRHQTLREHVICCQICLRFNPVAGFMYGQHNSPFQCQDPLISQHPAWSHLKFVGKCGDEKLKQSYLGSCGDKSRISVCTQCWRQVWFFWWNFATSFSNEDDSWIKLEEIEEVLTNKCFHSLEVLFMSFTGSRALHKRQYFLQYECQMNINSHSSNIHTPHLKQGLNHLTPNCASYQIPTSYQNSKVSFIARYW